jgi:hypothetical protein
VPHTVLGTKESSEQNKLLPFEWEEQRVNTKHMSGIKFYEE